MEGQSWNGAYVANVSEVLENTTRENGTCMFGMAGHAQANQDTQPVTTANHNKQRRHV